MMTDLNPSSRGRWQRVNVWAGYVIFGFPAVAAIPAMVATVTKFGLLDTLLSAVLPAVVACLPLALWIHYTRRRPGTYTGKVTWFVIAIVALGALVFSPLFFWAGPATLVLISEILRLISGTTFTSVIARVRAGRKALITRNTR